MPLGFTNYHSATIDDTKFKGYRWAKDSFGVGVSALYGIRAKEGVRGGKTTVASIRFSADKFSPSEAKAWLKKHEYKAVKFEKARAKSEGYPFPLIVAIYELTSTAMTGPAGLTFHYPSTDSIDPESKKKKQRKIR